MVSSCLRYTNDLSARVKEESTFVPIGFSRHTSPVVATCTSLSVNITFSISCLSRCEFAGPFLGLTHTYPAPDRKESPIDCRL